jgi:hypothetical protein
LTKSVSKSIGAYDDQSVYKPYSASKTMPVTPYSLPDSHSESKSASRAGTEDQTFSKSGPVGETSTPPSPDMGSPAPFKTASKSESGSIPDLEVPYSYSTGTDFTASTEPATLFKNRSFSAHVIYSSDETAAVYAPYFKAGNMANSTPAELAKPVGALDLGQQGQQWMVPYTASGSSWRRDGAPYSVAVPAFLPDVYVFANDSGFEYYDDGVSVTEGRSASSSSSSMISQMPAEPVAVENVPDVEEYTKQKATLESYSTAVPESGSYSQEGTSSSAPDTARKSITIPDWKQSSLMFSRAS